MSATESPTAPDTAPADRGAGEVAALRAMLVEMEAAASEMLNSLPGHWHDDATIRLTDAAEDARKALERPAGYSPSDDEPDVLASPAPDPQAGSDSPAASGVDAEGRQAFERYPHLASAIERYGNHNSLENWGLMLGAINDTLATPPPAVPATRDAGLDRATLCRIIRDARIAHLQTPEIVDLILAEQASTPAITIERIGKDRQGVTVRFAESEWDNEVFRIEEPLPGLAVVLDADGSILHLDIEDLKADMVPPEPTPGKAPGQDAVEALKAILQLTERYKDHPITALARTALAAIRATQADTGGDAHEFGRATPLALVMREYFEGGHLSEDAKLLVAAALFRIWPDDRHTVETCDCERDPDLDADEPKCSECPTDAQWRDADAKLDAWLASRSPAPTLATDGEG